MDADKRIALGRVASAAEFFADDIQLHWCCGNADDFQEHLEWLENRVIIPQDARHLALHIFEILKVYILTASPRYIALFLDRRVQDLSEPVCDALCGIIESILAMKLGTKPKASEIDSATIESLRVHARRLQGLAAFVPSDLQRAILDTLEGHAMTADTLEGKLSVSRHTLYGGKNNRGGLNELMDMGRIKNNRKMGGYYRPDAPPEILIKAH